MDTINDKLDKMLLEFEDPTTREIIKMISSAMKLTDLPLELGDNEKYVKNKPFVEERIRQNFKMKELLPSQINNNLLLFISQDFSNSKSEEENMVESQVPIQQASRNFFPEGQNWPFPQGPWKDIKDD